MLFSFFLGSQRALCQGAPQLLFSCTIQQDEFARLSVLW